MWLINVQYRVIIYKSDDKCIRKISKYLSDNNDFVERKKIYTLQFPIVKNNVILFNFVRLLCFSSRNSVNFSFKSLILLYDVYDVYVASRDYRLNVTRSTASSRM